MTNEDKAALETFSRKYLKPPSEQKEPGAQVLAVPLPYIDHGRVNVPGGWDDPERVLPAFAESPTPIVLEAGETIYRFIGRGVDTETLANSIAGPWWCLKMPATLEEWHTKYAIKGLWNMDGGYVKLTLEHDIKVWRGPAAPQTSSASGYVLPGGGDQIWARRIDPRDHGKTIAECLHPAPWAQVVADA